mgnify:FL=1
MKLKKFFAGVLAAAMMLTVGATAAFAVNPATTYQDQSEVKIYKHYGVEGNGTSPEETFYLVQANKQVLTGDISAEDVPNLIELTTKPDGANGYYVASVKFDEGGAKASETENVGAFVVTLPTYDHVGKFEYTLQEVAGNTAGVTYRLDTIKLVVSVINDGKIRVAGVHTENEGGEKSSSFSDNKYAANTLTVSKYVSGNMGDKKTYFQFELSLEPGTANDRKNFAENYTITYPTNGSDKNTTNTIVVGGASVKFWLKSGESISIANLPEGVEWTVSELDADGKAVANGATNGVYTVSVDGANGSIVAAGASETSNKASFTNTHEGTPDMGVILDNAPYIALLAIVAIGGVALMLNKRRRDEE